MLAGNEPLYIVVMQFSIHTTETLQENCRPNRGAAQFSGAHETGTILNPIEAPRNLLRPLRTGGHERSYYPSPVVR